MFELLTEEYPEVDLGHYYLGYAYINTVMVGNDPNSTDPMWDAIIPPKDTTGWTRARRSALATIKEASAITPAPTNHPRPTRIEDIALWYAIHSTARTQWKYEKFY